MKIRIAEVKTLKSPAYSSRVRTRLVVAMVTAVIAGGFSAGFVQAYTVTLQQIGSNVVATGTGAIDLTGLNPGGTGSFTSQMNPSFPDIYTGTNGAPIRGYITSSFTGFPNFGSGGMNPANTSFGDFVGILQLTLNPFFHLLAFDIPLNYNSNDPLSSSATWNNASFATLGVTPGIYEWTWGTGTGNENFTIDVVAPAVPDSGSAFGLFFVALAALFAGSSLRPTRSA